MREKLLKIKTNQQGFTLIEIIVTLVIVGILVTILNLHFINLSHSADTAACLANQYALVSAQEVYYVKTFEQEAIGHYAESLNDLVPYIIGGQIPDCPRDGEYFILPEGEISCTISDHQLK